MSFFHLRPLAGNTWPPLPEAGLSQLWAAYLTLDKTQWLDAAEIERRQLAQVRTLLVHAVTQVPYYRKVLPEAGIFPGAIQTMADFRRIPLLSRQTYQERFEEFQATSLPEGTQARGESITSGTSGVRIKVLQTNVVQLWWFAFYLRDLEWCRMDPTASLAAVRATESTGPDLQQLLQGVSLPYWSKQLHALIETGPSHGMDIHQDHRRQLAWLRQIDPDYFLSYPPNLEVLAGLIEEDGQRLPRLKAMQTISEPLTDEAKMRIEKAFGVPVKNTYSCTEAGYMASPCMEGHGLHVHAENVLFEVLDERNLPCKPGQTGRVVLTTLHNLRGPFIRYELNDDVTLGQDRCPCGRGLPLLKRVDGKRRPLFHLPDGRRKTTSGLVDVFNSLGGHRQFQVVQTAADRVLVRLAVDKYWTDQHADQLRDKVCEFFEAPIQVDFEIGQRLELPRNGKLLCMVNELDSR